MTKYNKSSERVISKNQIRREVNTEALQVASMREINTYPVDLWKFLISLHNNNIPKGGHWVIKSRVYAIYNNLEQLFNIGDIIEGLYPILDMQHIPGEYQNVIINYIPPKKKSTKIYKLEISL